MAASFIQVAPDGSGKKMQTWDNLIGADQVHAEGVVLVDQFGVPLTGLPVTGPLTNVQLRATAVPISSIQLPSTIGAHAIGDSLSVCQNTGGVFVINVQTGAGTIHKFEDAASASADGGVPAMAIQNTTPVDTAGTDGDYAMLQMKNGRLWVSDDQSGPASVNVIRSTATTTAATLAVARPTRRGILIRNLDASITIYVRDATVTTANGFPILPGEGIPFGWTGLIQVISASGTPAYAAWDEF